MEKSWNVKEKKIMEFCRQPWNFTNFASRYNEIGMFLANIKKLNIGIESPHFLTFRPKCCEYKIEQRDGKSRNGHGKVMAKYVVKSVGTLVNVTLTELVYHSVFCIFCIKVFCKGKNHKMTTTKPRITNLFLLFHTVFRERGH